MKVQGQKVINVDANIFRSAQAFESKGDARYYLDGTLIAKNGDVVATDGHSLFKSSCSALEGLLIDDVIIKIDGLITKRAERLLICFESETIECLNSKGRSIKKLFFETVDGKYPDYLRVIPSRESVEPITSIGLNPSYVAKAACFEAAKFTFNGQGGAVSITPLMNADHDKNGQKWPDNTVIVIMPISF